MMSNKVSGTSCFWVMSLSAVVFLITGCCCNRPETGYHNFNKVQLQFTAPAGATVTLGKSCFGRIVPDRSHPINTYTQQNSRLERMPEQTSTFNLCPGKYEFKYNGLEQGWEDVNVYGDVEIYNVNSCKLPGAKEILRRVFIPITLTGPISAGSSLDIVSTCPNLIGCNPCDIQRLMAGEMITKVVFIADLTKISNELNQLEVDYVVLQAKRKELMTYRSTARLDFISCPSSCRSRRYISIERKLKENEQELIANRAKTIRYNTILNSNNVLIRREMLIMASDDILPPNEDPVKSAEEIGEVVMVMHIGSRHLQWGEPPWQVVDTCPEEYVCCDEIEACEY